MADIKPHHRTEQGVRAAADRDGVLHTDATAQRFFQFGNSRTADELPAFQNSLYRGADLIRTKLILAAKIKHAYLLHFTPYVSGCSGIRGCGGPVVSASVW